MGQTQSESGRKVFHQFHLVLGISSDAIHLLVDIARSSLEVVLTPIGTKDGSGVFRESEDGLQITLHHTLFLRLHIVAHGIVFRCHIILLTITEAVDGEIGLQGVLTCKLIDASKVPTEPFVTHLVVSTACDVFAALRTICYLI